MGADIVIAVDVSRVKRNAEITTIYDVIMQSIDIMQTEIINNRETSADVMIKPSVEMFSSRAFTHHEEIINIGKEETKNHLQQIVTVIEQWKGNISDAQKNLYRILNIDNFYSNWRNVLFLAILCIKTGNGKRTWTNHNG